VANSEPVILGDYQLVACAAFLSFVYADTKSKLGSNVGSSFYMNIVYSFTTACMQSEIAEVELLLNIFSKLFLEMLYKLWSLMVFD
jgi:hypothetical protein